MDVMWPQSVEDARALVADAIAVFGKFRPEACAWLADHMMRSRGPGDWDVYVNIVQGGEQVPVEEKGAWGHPKWFKFGRPGWDAMTDLGRYQPREAVEELASHLFWKSRLPYRRTQLADLLASTGDFFKAIAIDATDLCCTQARSIAKKRFPITAYPDLPLPGCSQVWCKCEWRALT